LERRRNLITCFFIWTVILAVRAAPNIAASSLIPIAAGAVTLQRQLDELKPIMTGAISCWDNPDDFGGGCAQSVADIDDSYIPLGTLRHGKKLP